MPRLSHFEDKFGKTGYQNEDTQEIVILPQYDEGTLYFGSDSYSKKPYASVLLNSKCGIIDEKGEIVIPIEFEEAYYLFDDLFAVRKSSENGEWILGIINSIGEIIVPFKYKSIQRSNAFIKCSLNASSVRIYSGYGWGSRRMDVDGHIYRYDNEEDVCWINKNGDIIYNGDVVESAYNVLIIEKQGKLGAIDTEGQMVADFAYDEMHCPCINRFIVRKNLSEDDWRFGVLDEKQKSIIDFVYKHIDSEDGSFYQCYEKCESEHISYAPINKNYRYSETEDEVWLNSNGKKIVSGDAEVLSNNFLLVERNKKKGIYNQSGKRIVNFIYDEILERNGYLAVSKEGRVGILGKNGEVIIDASYEQIECVHMTNKRYGGYSEPLTFGKYSPENPFDTSSKNKFFFRRSVRCNRILRVEGKFFFNPSNVFILHNKEYSELFTIEDGILPDSRFKTILALTDTHFAVKDEEKWGVYCAGNKQMIIPCEYDRIMFEGKYTVLLRKNDLWGAKTLLTDDDFLKDFLDVDIPIAFYEIKILDDIESLFSVKCKYEYLEEDSYYYTIVNNFGEKEYKIRDYCDAHFIFYSFERVLSYRNGKYGFINILDGYTSIPFKYDKIEKREDGLFDVCVNDAWGVLDITSGKETVLVKYAKRIPLNYDKLIVKELATDCWGILNEAGQEYVPTIYEHLILSEEKDLIFFGYRGHETDEGNFFSGNISHAIWGCLNSSGDCIINAKYDCFKIQDGYILAGRDGTMLGHGQEWNNYYEDEYGGVYDLFDYSGNLLIGGFRTFKYNRENEILFLQFGGKWHMKQGEYSIWSYSFEKGNGRWLALDNSLCSILRKNNGERLQFRKGFIGTITPKSENGKTIHYWNMPLELFSIEEPYFSYDLMVCGDEHQEWAVRFSDDKTSAKYNKIGVIGNSLYFITDTYDGKCGIGIAMLSNDENEVEIILVKPIPENYIFTYPIGGYTFVISEIDKDLSIPRQYTVSLYNINAPLEKAIVAIKTISKDKLMMLLEKGDFLITLDEDSSGYSSIILPNLEIFDEDFIHLISDKKIEKDTPKLEIRYWSTNGWNSLKSSDRENYYDNDFDMDYTDYMKDTWYAMTDGMYGDMPDGWDGNYEFLGY